MCKEQWRRTIRVVMLSGVLMLAGWAQAEVGPQQLIRSTADHVLQEVIKNKAELEKDDSNLYRLVKDRILPHFDFMRMSQAAMGRHWRKASADQRERLAFEFQELLVRTYATALLNYSGQSVEYLPVRIRPGASDVLIPTRVAATGSPPIPINYRLHRSVDEWKVYDIVVNSVSLVTNYRSQFDSLMRAGGVEGVISRLQGKNQQNRGGAERDAQARG